MIGSAVFAKLSSLNLGVITTKGVQRIYPNYVRMGDKQYPQLVFDCENYQLDYGTDGSDGVPSIDVKVLAVGQTYDDADALGRAVATALDGTRGTWGDINVRGCFLTEVSEDHFVDTDLETILYFQKELTFKVVFSM
jgi:hypothetical protein